MKPLRLTAQHYGPFRDLDVDLPLGAVAVIGPNGAGKSTLVNAIGRALFGSRTMGDWLTTGEVDGAMSLTLEFEHAGQVYRVRRGYSAKGRGKPSLDFERQWSSSTDNGHGLNASVAHAEGWEPLTRETIKETQSEIERVLGFTRDIFRASAFLVQGSEGSFTSSSLDPRQRKQMLADLLGLSIYDRLLERVRLRSVTIRDQAIRLRIQVEEGERDLARLTEVDDQRKHRLALVRDANLRLGVAETAHREATEKLNASREVAAKLAAAREVLASRERELENATARHRSLAESLRASEELPRLRAEAETLAGRRESIEAELAAAREGEKAREEHRRLVAERDRLLDAANELRNKEAGLFERVREAESSRTAPVCDRCNRPLEDESRAHAIQSMKTEGLGCHVEAAALTAQAEQLVPTIAELEEKATGPNAAKQAELEAALRVAGEADRTLASIAEREKILEEHAQQFALLDVQLPDLTRERDAAELAVHLLEADAPSEDLEAAVARAYGDLHEARNDVEGAKSRLAVAQAELKRLSTIAAQNESRKVELGKLQDDLALLDLADRAYGKAGIPALVLENRAIPLLEAKANEALSKLGGKTASARVELRTQREKKDGAGLIEALDIVVVTAEGYERRYESWSGGEQMRLDVAIRLGLLALSGAEMGILILDEPGNLDESGKADLIALLDSVLALGIERVLLVSHDPDLREAFDQVIEIEVGEDGRSRVAGATVEAVAA